MPAIPQWQLKGDWFDVCKCAIPCPCSFAQPPTFGDCAGILAWRVSDGHYGNIPLSGLSVMAVGTFEGNLWAGDSKAIMAIFIDEKAGDDQRVALQTIFGGQAGGWPGVFAGFIGEVRGMEFAPIRIDIAPDLAYWRAEIPGKAEAYAEPLTGPTLQPGKRVQVHNLPGCEVGPGAGPSTWGKAITDRVDVFGFKWEFDGRSSKLIPFDWSGPDS